MAEDTKRTQRHMESVQRPFLKPLGMFAPFSRVLAKSEQHAGLKTSVLAHNASTESWFMQMFVHFANADRTTYDVEKVEF